MVKNSRIVEKSITHHKQVWCNGGGTLGHPRVYLEIDSPAGVTCPYCSHLFIYKPKDLTINKKEKSN